MKRPARYTIASIPHPVKVLGLLTQPAEPFVMVNMLVYKDQATGKFAHLTGREAYSIYAESAMRAQSTMGSRLIWTGEVTEQLAGKALPDFGTVALLEYARPTRLFRFMAGGNYDEKARFAGLAGQWLVAAKTLAETPEPVDESDAVLVEVLSGAAFTERTAPGWLATWQRRKEAAGGRLVWMGRAGVQPLGSAKPRLRRFIVTRFADDAALDAAFAADDAQPLRNRQVAGLSDYIALRATTTHEFDEFLAGDV